LATIQKLKKVFSVGDKEEEKDIKI